LEGEDAVVATPPKMTVDEFFKLHESEAHVDLVRGQVGSIPYPALVMVLFA
jgi:hypothetical protein